MLDKRVCDICIESKLSTLSAVSLRSLAVGDVPCSEPFLIQQSWKVCPLHVVWRSEPWGCHLSHRHFQRDTDPLKTKAKPCPGSHHLEVWSSRVQKSAQPIDSLLHLVWNNCWKNQIAWGGGYQDYPWGLGSSYLHHTKCEQSQNTKKDQMLNLSGLVVLLSICKIGKTVSHTTANLEYLISGWGPRNLMSTDFQVTEFLSYSLSHRKRLLEELLCCSSVIKPGPPSLLLCSGTSLLWSSKSKSAQRFWFSLGANSGKAGKSQCLSLKTTFSWIL